MGILKLDAEYTRPVNIRDSVLNAGTYVWSYIHDCYCDLYGYECQWLGPLVADRTAQVLLRCALPSFRSDYSDVWLMGVSSARLHNLGVGGNWRLRARARCTVSRAPPRCLLEVNLFASGCQA